MTKSPFSYFIHVWLARYNTQTVRVFFFNSEHLYNKGLRVMLSTIKAFNLLLETPVIILKLHDSLGSAFSYSIL